MGAQAYLLKKTSHSHHVTESNSAMAPAMKAMKAPMKAMKAKSVKAMPKSGIAEAIANATDLKKSDVSKVLNTLAEVGAKEVKKTGKFVLPGLAMIKRRLKKATPAGTREMFGKVVRVKAMKAKTVVKAFAVAALKNSI